MHDAFTLPAGTVARLQIIPPPLAASLPFVVVMAGDAGRATPETFFASMMEPAAVTAMLTHSQGVSWPDRAGEALLAATLERGGIALLVFAALGDAMACRTRAKAHTAPGGQA